MLTHFQMNSRLQALEANTLSEKQRVALRAHLRSCSRCAETWRQMQAVRSAFAEENFAGPALTTAAADALFQRAFDLSRAETRRAAPQRRLLPWAFGGGLAAAGLACGLFYFAPSHHSFAGAQSHDRRRDAGNSQSNRQRHRSRLFHTGL